MKIWDVSEADIYDVTRNELLEKIDKKRKKHESMFFALTSTRSEAVLVRDRIMENSK